MNEFFRRVRYLLNRRRFDQELASDMEFHREMAAREGGRPFGNALHLREEAREAWGWTWLERLSQDIRYAARMLRKSPGFALAAVLVLSVGIGVNVAAFGFYDLMVLRPLPVRHPATLVRFERFSPKAYASVLPYPEMAFFRSHATTVSAVLAWNRGALTMEDEPKPITAHYVTANFFRELGAATRVGRLLADPLDETDGAEPVAVLSQAFWERHFGADPSVAGRTIRLNGKPVTVAGVVDRGFAGLSMDNVDVWLPVIQQPYFVNGSKLLTDFSVDASNQEVWGRLKPGVTPTVAEAELRSLAAVLHAEHPNDIWENETLPSKPGGFATSMFNGSHHGTGAKDPNLMAPAAALVGALGMLILVAACGNLGGLLLARGVARQREIAIRVAVGAGRGRLLRQLFTESLLLGLLGSIAALGLGYVVLRILISMSEIPQWLNPAPDWRVVLFAIAMGFASAIVFGLTPAVQIVRQRHQATLMRQILIGTQVSASCILLIVAGILVRTLNHASADPGFAYKQVTSIDPALGNHAYSPARARAYFDTLQSRLRAVPGIESVSLASNPPFGEKNITIGITLMGHSVGVHTNKVDPQYFQTMKIPLLEGHNPLPGESLAARAWPGESPLGKVLELVNTKYTVVGMSANVSVTAPQEPNSAEAYFPAEASDLPSMVALVYSAGRPEDLTAALASIARELDPKILPEVQSMKRSLQRKLESTEYGALAGSLFALVALLLACLGIVGLVAFAVSQRTKEIGIRMALGAKPSHILFIVLRQFSLPVGAGLLAGVAGAAALSQVVRGTVFGTASLDPITYLGAIGLFTATAALASLAPARLALRVDAISALRND
jgi:predicted permease